MKLLGILHDGGCVVLRPMEDVVYANDAIGVRVKRDIVLHLKRAVATRAQMRVGAKGF